MQNIVVAPKMLFIRQIYSNIPKIDYISVTVDPVSRVESICQLVVAVCIDVSRDSDIIVYAAFFGRIRIVFRSLETRAKRKIRSC